MMLTEEVITSCLRAAYQPGVISSTDGFAALLAAQSDQPLTGAAVLMPLVWRDGEWHLLFTRRTQSLENHKGQVSFPGGACDPGEGSEQTALREAEEEIGLRPVDVHILGRLNDVVTITNYRVAPVVGIMPWLYNFRLAEVEVARVFSIPLAWLAQRKNWDEHDFTPDNLPRPYPVITYHPYDGEILWGASARITQNFLSVLGLL